MNDRRRYFERYFREKLTAQFGSCAPTQKVLARAVSNIARRAMENQIRVQVDPDTCVATIVGPKDADTDMIAAVASDAMRTSFAPFVGTFPKEALARTVAVSPTHDTEPTKG